MNTAFFPVVFILIITVIAVELWWFWFSYPHDQNMSLWEFILLEFITAGCLILSFFSFANRFSEKFVFFAPFIPLFFYFSMTKISALKEKIYEEKKLKQEIDKIMNSHGIYENSIKFEKIGDIYSSHQDFENAALWYKKSLSLKETPEISHKLNTVRQEILLKQKKIWICPECSTSNSINNKKCKYCGTLKPSVETIKQEFYKSLAELRKNIVFFIFFLVVISIFVWFIKNSSFSTSLVFFSILFVPFAIYIIFKIFSK